MAVERQNLVVRLDPELYDAVVNGANEKGLSMNDYVSSLIARANKIKFKPRGGRRGLVAQKGER